MFSSWSLATYLPRTVSSTHLMEVLTTIFCYSKRRSIDLPIQLILYCRLQCIFCFSHWSFKWRNSLHCSKSNSFPKRVNWPLLFSIEKWSSTGSHLTLGDGMRKTLEGIGTAKKNFQTWNQNFNSHAASVRKRIFVLWMWICACNKQKDVFEPKTV